MCWDFQQIIDQSTQQNSHESFWMASLYCYSVATASWSTVALNGLQQQELPNRRITLENPQIYKGDPRTCAIFIPAWVSNWGYSGFSCDQNNRDLSGAYILRSECEDIINVWNATQHAKIMAHFVCVCFYVCGRQKPTYPQFEPHGWRRHYMWWYTRSGISLLYLWENLTKMKLLCRYSVQ